MKVAFFHGLESAPYCDKNVFMESRFESVYAPAIDYQNPYAFKNQIQYLRKNPVDILIGSSMGGWFAYCASTVLGIPTLMFNPAMDNRSFDPEIYMGSRRSKHQIVFGNHDDVVDSETTKRWIKSHGIGTFEFHYDNFAHRIPIGIFSKWVTAISHSGIQTFESYSMLNGSHETFDSTL